MSGTGPDGPRAWPGLDLAGATKDGQQLFFANMVFKRRRIPLPEPGPWTRRDKNRLPYQPGTGFDNEAWEQLACFEMALDPEVVRQRVLVEDSDPTRYWAAIVNDHPQRYAGACDNATP